MREIPRTEQTYETTAQQVGNPEIDHSNQGFETFNPMPADHADIVDQKPLTDFEKYAKGIEFFMSIEDFDGLYADPAACALSRGAQRVLEIAAQMSRPTTTRKYV